MQEQLFIKLKSIIKDFKWQEAKTMKDKPHSYNVKSKNPNKEHFELLAKAIDNLGTPKKFFSKTYYYLEIDEYQYWSCEPKGLCTLINRALISDHNYNL